MAHVHGSTFRHFYLGTLFCHVFTFGLWNLVFGIVQLSGVFTEWVALLLRVWKKKAGGGSLTVLQWPANANQCAPSTTSAVHAAVCAWCCCPLRGWEICRLYIWENECVLRFSPISLPAQLTPLVPWPRIEKHPSSAYLHLCVHPICLSRYELQPGKRSPQKLLRWALVSDRCRFSFYLNFSFLFFLFSPLLLSCVVLPIPTRLPSFFSFATPGLFFFLSFFWGAQQYAK